MDICKIIQSQYLAALEMLKQAIVKCPSVLWDANKLELQFYNIRHIQQHTDELYERLGTRENIELDWVGAKPA